LSRKKQQISELNLSKIGGRISYIRLSAGESQDVFAKKIGISKGNLSDIENHRHNPSYIPIVRIIEHYSVNPLWLFFKKGEPYIKDSGDNGFIDMEGDTKEDYEFTQLMLMTTKILKSDTDYASSLAANIRSFYHALETERRLADHEKRLAILEEKLEDKAKSQPTAATAGK